MLKQKQPKKISLRPLQKSDADCCYANLRQKIFSKTASLPYPYTIEMARSFILWSHLAREKGTDEIFAIQDDATGNLVGMLGLHSLNSNARRTELGYWIARAEWGHGVATLAVGAALRFAFVTKRLQKVYAHVFTLNVASQRVLEKNGFRREGTLRRHFRVRGRYVDAYFFGLLREEWRGNKANVRR